MMIRTTKDIPNEVKNIVELFYIQDASAAQDAAIRLSLQHPEWKKLINLVLSMFESAPESVFMFYNELIARYNAVDAKPADFPSDDIDISLGDSLSGLLEDEPVAPAPAKQRRWTMNGNLPGSDAATPIPSPMGMPKTPAPAPVDEDSFDIDIDFDMDSHSSQLETKNPRANLMPSITSIPRPPASTVSNTPLEASEVADEIDMPFLDISSIFNDGEKFNDSSDPDPQDVKSTEMPLLDISSMMDVPEMPDATPSAFGFRSSPGINNPRELVSANEMTKSPVDGSRQLQSRNPAFNSSELQRLRSNLTGGADIMRAASQKNLKAEPASSRHLVGNEAGTVIPNISPLSRGEGRARAYTASGIPAADIIKPETQMRPTAIGLTPISGYKPINSINNNDEHRTVSGSAPIPPIAIAGMSKTTSADRRPSASISSMSSSQPNHKFSSLPDDPKPTVQSLSPISMMSQKSATPDFGNNDAKQTVMSMSPIAITPRKKSDPENGKRALERIQPISRVPNLKCRLSEISQRKDINPRAGFILSMIDGFTSISDILDISAWPEYDTAELLLELEQQGIIVFT